MIPTIDMKALADYRLVIRSNVCRTLGPIFLINVAFAVCSCANPAFGQWDVGANVGAAFPITGYGEVVKTGYLVGLESKHYVKEGFSLGIEVYFARLANDKDASDEFQDAKITVAPLLFVAEKTFSTSGLRPYVAGGLGISFFNVHYEISPTEGHADNNVSFTMSPQVGLKYIPNKLVSYFFEVDALLVADGPPVGFPMGEKLTGYWSLKIGFNYRLKEGKRNSE